MWGPLSIWHKELRSVTFRFQSTVWKQLTSSWNNRIYTSHIKSVFQTSQHFLVESFLSRNRYCLLYFHLERGKLNKRSRTESERERGKVVSEKSRLRVGQEKVLAWVLPPIPQPYPGQRANKSACQHRWSRTPHWGRNKHRSLSVTMWEL